MSDFSIKRIRRLIDDTDSENQDYSDETLETYIENRGGDLYAAASDIWEEKAAELYKAYNFNADGASLNRREQYQNALRMATFMKSRSRVQTLNLGPVTAADGGENAD